MGSAALVNGLAGTYLIINDATAGFQANSDSVIHLQGFTGSLQNFVNLSTGQFIG
jgi:hypothetical protein